LITSNDLSCNTKMNLKKIYIGQKTYDKTELEYVEIKSLYVFKYTRSSKEKKEQSQELENKIDNMKNIIMHINISIQIVEIGTITIIKKIEI
jgi:hypothetical protein